MTNEQIKQNADAYASKNAYIPKVFGVEVSSNKDDLKQGYIAGAHSRDEEIKELKEEIESLQEQYNTCFDGFTKRGTKLGELMKENVKLRNPWISVEDKLPEEHSKVLIMFCNGTVTYNDYIGVGDINYMKAHSKTITHWMPIPELN